MATIPPPESPAPNAAPPIADAKDPTEEVYSGSDKTARGILLALLGSNVFALFIGGIYEYLSLRGVISMRLAWVVLLFVWVLGVVGIVVSEWAWGKGLRQRFTTGIAASLILGVLLIAFHLGVSWITRPQVTVTTTPQPHQATPSSNPPPPTAAVAEKPKITQKRPRAKSPYYTARECPPGKMLLKQGGPCIDMYAPGIYGEGPGQLSDPHTTLPSSHAQNNQTCAPGSICNQDSQNNGTQTVINGGLPGKLSWIQSGNKVTLTAVGGDVQPVSIGLIFDADVALKSKGVNCMTCGDSRLNDAEGEPDKKTVWVFWKGPAIRPDDPVTMTFSSASGATLLRIVQMKMPDFANPKQP